MVVIIVDVGVAVGVIVTDQIGKVWVTHRYKKGLGLIKVCVCVCVTVPVVIQAINRDLCWKRRQTGLITVEGH